MAPPASPTMRVSRATTPRCAPCGWPTVRTRCTIAPLPDLNFGSMQTLRLRTRGSVRKSGAPPGGRLKSCRHPEEPAVRGRLEGRPRTPCFETLLLRNSPQDDGSGLFTRLQQNKERQVADG